MRTAWPLIPATACDWLDVGDGHRVYFEDAGPRDGLPVVFLHGGPGSGCKPSHRQFFDPTRYRSVLVDQRGSGRSTPFAGCEHNTTRDLVADLERLRVHLGLEAWVVFAGSWGVALGLAYAQAYPSRVLGMILRGSFLARQTDLDWFLAAGAGRLLPRAWAAIDDALGHPAAIVEEVHRRVFGDDDALALAAARAWSRWSGEVVSFSLDHAEVDPEPSAGELIGKTRIEMHYAQHRYFLEPDELLARAPSLPRVPVMIIHGQRDITCTPDASLALHRAIPGSTLEILRTAGHLSAEPAMADALLRAADRMVDVLGPHG
ncbi:MAG: prolyl aminopeptidase [Gammaproteobacteria bacterium]|nr:prolyl aminopeptidase [Gammaproteobacteria bacterium]